MKVELVKKVEEPVFKSLEITLTVENKEEADRLYALCNHFSITESFKLNEFSIGIRTALTNVHSNDFIYKACSEALYERITK